MEGIRMDNILTGNNKDLREIILKQREGRSIDKWEGTCLDYLYLIKERPDIANFAPGRIYNMIMKYGIEEVDESLKTRGYEDLVRYKFFDNRIYGTLEPIHDIMKFFKAAARRTETAKRILMMVGPVSSGKSTISYWIKRGLESDDTLAYAIKDCPMREDPLHLIPLADRPYWNDFLGMRIEGHLCPVCLQRMKSEYSDNHGNIKWEKVPIVSFKFSEQERSGIGTFAPTDPRSQDVSELIGRVNMALISKYGEDDPRGYNFNGEIQVANRGLIEYIEILKADSKLHYVLITLAQEQLIKSPGFPQIYIDTLILSHTNETEFDSFRADRKNEALHDRMYPIRIPLNVRINDEIKIYEKMIRESDFRNIHLAPNTLKIAAEFAILSRLVKSTKVSSSVEKMKVYNGERTEEFKKQEIDTKSLLQEGRDAGEGMSGISPRFIINALNVALGMKEDKKCINPVDVIRALRSNFDHHIGISDEDKGRFINMLIGEKESVSSEFKEIAKKEVNMAFLYAYEEQAQTLFDNYMKNISSFCKKEKVFDSITGEYSDSDEKLMRSIEELAGVPVNSKAEFRNSIFVYKADALERGKDFTYKDYTILKDAVEKKLIGDLKNIVGLSLGDTTTTDPKMKKKREKALERLLEHGYCDSCANNLLSFVAEILRREN